MDRSHRRLSQQPGRYYSLQILFAQDHGRALGPVVQHQVFKQVARLWYLHGVYRVQCMWFPWLPLGVLCVDWDIFRLL